MQGNIKISASGLIQVYSLNDNKKELILTTHNQINPIIAADVIARALGGYNISTIDKIVAYYNNSLLGNAPITPLTISHPGPGIVSFTGTFPASAFYGPIDRLELTASAMGFIAEGVNLTLLKPFDTALVVNWTITVIIQ